MTTAVLLFCVLTAADEGPSTRTDPRVRRCVDRGLEHLARTQARNGRWEAAGASYPVAMTSLAGICFLLDGNTTLQGRYARNVQSAVEYIVAQAQPSGLVGDPDRDSRYLYGHGFAMLFLSQVLGEEEDLARRRQLVDVLTKAVLFSGKAQTVDGGWGYVSARDGNGFDEGSVTITQMQGLRACRNAGVPVPKEVVDKGVKYLERCTDAEGGVRYSLKTRGEPRPPITAAAVACLFSAGEYTNPLVAKLVAYSDKMLFKDDQANSFGHWHYAHYYYAQTMYTRGGPKWDEYRRRVYKLLMDQQTADGGWDGSYVGVVYTTALNLTILQLDGGCLPIYQR
ncbi:MAG: prenyltransferase/squalene oxidase repeat-containing protein [Planctomycetia bacterium]